MSLIGLFAWMCLLVSCFAHVSTFFEGGATFSLTSLLVMHSLAVLFFIAALRHYKEDGKSFAIAFPPSSLAIFVAVALYVGVVDYRATQLPPAEVNVAKVYERDQRVSAREWSGLWILAYLIPVLFYSRREVVLRSPSN